MQKQTDQRISRKDLTQYCQTNTNESKTAILPRLTALLDLNDRLDNDDVYTIRTAEFYDDVHDDLTDYEEILDDHFLTHLYNGDDSERELMRFLVGAYSG